MEDFFNLTTILFFKNKLYKKEPEAQALGCRMSPCSHGVMGKAGEPLLQLLIT